jgi:hypothetical protein
LNTQLRARNKMQTIGSLAVPVLRLELLTGIKKKYRNWIEKQEKCQKSMDSITQEHTLIAYMSQKRVRKRINAGGRSLNSRNS